MNVLAQLAELKKRSFVTLILDNEVTVSHFVTEPPLTWLRIARPDGEFRIADDYPTRLTPEQARFEMKNWDDVSLPGIQRLLAQLDDVADYFVIGNNAGQGLPLAQDLAGTITASRAAVIYAERLPEIKLYEQMGYRTFWRRDQAVLRLLELAQSAGKILALALINTIQHNETNYHDP